MRKLFVTDVDGTLLKGSKHISNEIIAHLRHFVAEGNLFGIATGRSIVSTKWLWDILPINIPAILLTGSCFYRHDAEVFSSVTYLPESILATIEEMLTYVPDLSVQYFTLGDIYLVKSNAHLEQKGVQDEYAYSLRHPWHNNEKRIIKVVVTHADTAILKYCGNKYFSKEPQVSYQFASNHFVEIVSSSSNKGLALQKLMETYHVGVEQVYAAGDAMTDLPMLQIAGNSLCPSDAATELIKVSQFVFPPAKENGFLEAIKYVHEHRH